MLKSLCKIYYMILMALGFNVSESKARKYFDEDELDFFKTMGFIDSDEQTKHYELKEGKKIES